MQSCQKIQNTKKLKSECDTYADADVRVFISLSGNYVMQLKSTH